MKEANMNAVSIKNESLASMMAANDAQGSKLAGSQASTKPYPASALPSATPVIPKASKADKPRKLEQSSHLQLQFQTFMQWLLPPLFGLLMLLGVWALIAAQSQGLPGPVKTFHSAVELFRHPFYVNGPNDQGIGWNILASLKRVGLGFGLAALVGIPLGFMIGRFEFLNRMTAPVISLLRPVSPLAWLPIGLLVFKAANPAAIWVIFISAIWPMIINTAVGVSKVPQDYMNVAKVLNLSEWKIVTKILFPSVLPYMMTGVRLSIGVAWLVIVAAEMLTGGVGIGFWVWDEWNNLNVEHIIIAIFVVGIVGLLLEQSLLLIARRFSYE
jgi:nitrate/nitrite transport system permease protein